MPTCILGGPGERLLTRGGNLAMLRGEGESMPGVRGAVLLIVPVATLLAVAVPAGPASGSASGASPVKISLSQSICAPGSKLVISGSGFAPDGAMTANIDNRTTLGSGHTSSADTFSLPVNLPGAAVLTPGVHVVRVVAGRQGGSASLTIAAGGWVSFGNGPAGDRTNANPWIGTAQAKKLVKRWGPVTGKLLVNSTPSVVQGVDYVGSFDFNVYALNAVTGVKLWSFPTGSLVESSPAVSGGVVYVGSDDDHVYALNAANAAELWSYAAKGFVTSSPVVNNGVVYVGAKDGNVYALNAATGALIWKFATHSRSSESSAAVANGVVYVGSSDGHVYALKASSGTKLWAFSTGAAVSSSPAVSGGVVYVGSDDQSVYALNAASGAKRWSFRTGGLVESSPAVANGLVYVGSFDNRLYALNAATGAKVWSYATGREISSSPAVANGVVYVGSWDYRVYAIDAAGGSFLWAGLTGN